MKRIILVVVLGTVNFLTAAGLIWLDSTFIWDQTVGMGSVVEGVGIILTRFAIIVLFPVIYLTVVLGSAMANYQVAWVVLINILAVIYLVLITRFLWYLGHNLLKVK